MESALKSTAKPFVIVLFVLGWFALIGQFYLQMKNDLVSKGELVIRFFTYFKILTNLLIAICLSFVLLLPKSKIGQFFSNVKTLTALAVYIIVVGLIYNTILRFIWNPQGLQRVVDELLHLIIPLSYLIFWLFFVRKGLLAWHHFWPWIIFPLAYVILVLSRGHFSGFYPYPFLDVKQLGATAVFQNSIGVTLVFLIVSLVFIFIDKQMAQKKSLNY